MRRRDRRSRPRAPPRHARTKRLHTYQACSTYLWSDAHSVRRPTLFPARMFTVERGYRISVLAARIDEWRGLPLLSGESQVQPGYGPPYNGPRERTGSQVMYELFYAERSAAMGTRVVLEEIGAEYRLIDSDISDHAPRAPELVALNPNGWVPVLVYEGGTMHEASAITVFLTDRHPQAGLAPAVDDPLRGPFLQWLVYMSNTLQMAYQLTYYPWRFCETPDHHESAPSQVLCQIAGNLGLHRSSHRRSRVATRRALFRGRHPSVHAHDVAQPGPTSSDHGRIPACCAGRRQDRGASGGQESLQTVSGHGRARDEAGAAAGGRGGESSVLLAAAPYRVGHSCAPSG